MIRQKIYLTLDNILQLCYNVFEKLFLGGSFMKKALTLFLAALMLCSCATFTVSGSSSTDSENFAIVPVSDMDSDIRMVGECRA